MKTKTRDKVIFALAILLIMLLPIVIGLGSVGKAHAEGLNEPPEEVIADDEVIEAEAPTTIIKETVIDEQTALDNFFNRYIVPIVGGTAGTIIIAVLALLRPYIKRVGENKTLRAAYTAVKDKLTTAESRAEELKEQLKGVNLDAIIQSVTGAVIGAVSGKVSDIITEQLDKRNDLTAKIVADVEVVSAQIGNLISAAAVTWQNVDGVPKMLSTSPTATALEKQAKNVQFLKTLIAERLGLEATEIQEMLDEAVSSEVQHDEHLEV